MKDFVRYVNLMKWRMKAIFSFSVVLMMIYEVQSNLS